MRNILFAAVVVLIAAFSRLLPHPANFTPIAAIALTGGIYFNRKYAVLVPLAALVLSDALIGFHNLIPYVYGSFVVTALIGLWLRSRKNPVTVFAGSLAGSLLFFLVTNFGVWLSGDGAVYPATWEGLLSCYTLALPFFRNTVMGDLLYTGVLAGIFELAYRYLGSFAPESSLTRK